MNFGSLTVRAFLCVGSMLACATAPLAGATCADESELQCINSTECTLHQIESKGRKQYVCLPAANSCELGFSQKSGTPQECEAKVGCVFTYQNCYCSPDVLCVCGGGPPSQCRQNESDGSSDSND